MGRARVHSWADGVVIGLRSIYFTFDCQGTTVLIILKTALGAKYIVVCRVRMTVFSY
jgi:hypothetical protein